MSTVPKVDPNKTHFQVLGLDENAKIVKRQVEEAYRKRADECLRRLGKIDENSAEAEALRARLAQLNAARAILFQGDSRKKYKAKLQELRKAERELEQATNKTSGGKSQRESSAVLFLHLRQQVERAREELQRLHERQYEAHAYDHQGGKRPTVRRQQTDAESEQLRRRTAPGGEKTAALAELAAQRPVRRF